MQFFDDGSDARARHKRIAVGVAVSLAVHALLLSAYRTRTAPADRAPELAPPRSITVRIRPLPPPPAPVARPEQESAKPAAEPGTVRERTRPRRVIAVPKQADRPAEPEPFVVEQPEQAEPESAKPSFDIDAARRMARQLANQPDPAKAGTAVGQFPEKPLETESKAARAIAGAKRRDCKDGLPGGLLGPLIIAMDKKDSGCKW
jgi:hypothetical protein